MYTFRHKKINKDKYLEIIPEQLLKLNGLKKTGDYP